MRATALFRIAASLLTASWLSCGHASALVLNFDTLADLEAVTQQYAGAGVSFQNATALTAGFSLNEGEFPPRSGQNVLFDDGGGMTIMFSPGVFDVGGYFTYVVPLTLHAYDGGGALLGSLASAFQSNLAVSGDPGSSPNEFLELATTRQIARLTISGDPGGSSFVLDDLTISRALPEPSSLALIALGMFGLLVRRRVARPLIAAN